jgi:hypothetical protein
MGVINLKKFSKFLLMLSLSLALIGTLGTGANDGDAANPHFVIDLD